VQCADIEVVSSSGRLPYALNGFSIVDPPIYPANGEDSVGFRNPWSGGGEPSEWGWYVTGPACFDETLNDCDLTAIGRRGHTTYSGATPVVPECSHVTVKQGDTPASIVAGLGGEVDWAAICTMNALRDCDVIPVGDKLVIPPCENYQPPQRSTPAPSTAESTTSADPSQEPLPTPAPVLTTAGPSQGPAPTPVSPCLKDKYEQCGGQDFAGDSCCPLGMWCMATNTWWSQCEPCDETWDASCVPTPSAPSQEAAPAPAAGPSCSKAKYAQCGGMDFTGDTCCPSGMWCMAGNTWWSQCEPCDETWDVKCAGQPSLRQVQSHKVQRHRFLGTMLFQAGSVLTRVDGGEHTDADGGSCDL